MKSVIFLILVLNTLFVSAQVDRKEIRKGNKEYEKEKYGESEIHYRKAIDKNPASQGATYNLGNALYKQDQYEAAVTKYESLLNGKEKPEDLSKYYYNLGNSYFKTQDFKKSIEAYKQSLRLNPKDTDAKHNLFLAQNMLNQQQQQQQQNKDQEQQDNNDQDNDQDQQQNDNEQQQQEQQQDQDQQQQQQQQQQEQQISKEDAERLLEALEQDEKDLMKELQERKAQVRKIPVEKEW